MSVPVQQEGPRLVTVPAGQDVPLVTVPAAPDAQDGTVPAQQGARLLMSLRRLENPVDRPVVPRLLNLEPPLDAGLAAWAVQVRSASEACLLVDDQGRVAAMSIGCGLLLDAEPVRTVGSVLLDLIALVDFSAAAVPLHDPELQLPPLRALRSGGMARGLVRRRRSHGGLATYDVVGVPLAGGAGALAFLTEI